MVQAYSSTTRFGLPRNVSPPVGKRRSARETARPSGVRQRVVGDPSELTLTPVEAVRHGARLRRGLDLITVSLLLIPVTPVVLLVGAAMGGGDEWLLRLGLLVMLEHGLWLTGLRVATEFALTRPGTRRPARWARNAAAVDAVAAVGVVLCLVLTANFEEGWIDAVLYPALAVALGARVVALWTGAQAVAAGLRALGCVRLAWSLRGLAALACPVAVVAAFGLGQVLFAEAGPLPGDGGNSPRDSSYRLPLTGLSLLWFLALTAGGVCLVATRELN